MIGTSYEMLLFFCYQHETGEILNISPARLRVLRKVISRRQLKEETACEYLTTLGCKCIRPQVIAPAVIKDKNGRVFDEFSFVKLFFTRDMSKKFGFDYDHVMSMADKHKTTERRVFNHVIHKRRASIINERVVLDSIWSYEPIEILFTDSKLVDVRRMIGYKEWEEG